MGFDRFYAPITAIGDYFDSPKDIRRLREITRERKTFVKQTTQMKNPMPRA